MFTDDDSSLPPLTPLLLLLRDGLRLPRRPRPEEKGDDVDVDGERRNFVVRENCAPPRSQFQTRGVGRGRGRSRLSSRCVGRHLEAPELGFANLSNTEVRNVIVLSGKKSLLSSPHYFTLEKGMEEKRETRKSSFRV